MPQPRDNAVRIWAFLHPFVTLLVLMEVGPLPVPRGEGPVIDLGTVLL